MASHSSRNSTRKSETGNEAETSTSANDMSLSLFRRLSYGVGHFLNDCGSCIIFTYMLLFYQKILQMKPWMAGFMVLVVQLTDAFSTIFVGWKADKAPMFKCLEKVGRRKSWHLVGTIGVAITLPLLFSQCYLQSDVEWIQLFYFSVVNICYGFFWSCAQVTHLALIPDLSSNNPKLRVTLNSLRCSSALVSSMLTYGVLFAFLSNHTVGSLKISPDDLWRFRSAAWILVAISLVVVSFFYWGTKEASFTTSDDERSNLLAGRSDDQSLLSKSHRRSVSLNLVHSSSADPDHCKSASLSLDHPTTSHAENIQRCSMKPHDWLKKTQFYLIALIYGFSRHYINLSQLYFPFYIQYTQGFHKMYVAVFPLITFFLGFLTSAFISSSFISRHFNRKFSYFCGSVLALAACFWLWFNNLGVQLYFVSILMGISQSILLVTSLTFISDLVGQNTESSAFVYGITSFSDKIVIGVMSQIVQIFNPSPESAPVFYGDVMVFLPGGCVVVALVGLLILMPQTVGIQGNQQGEYEVLE